MSVLLEPAQQQALWCMLEGGHGVTEREMSQAIDPAAGTLRHTLRVWRARGLVRQVTDNERGQAASTIWCIDPAAQQVPPPEDGIGPEERMWRAMRKQRTFTPRDIAALASRSLGEIGEDEAGAFARMLLRAGYLRVIRKAAPGVRPARYRMLRDTGPRPPVERRIRAVWDQNTRAYAHLPEPQQ